MADVWRSSVHLRYARSESFQQFPAVADRNAKAIKVRIRQLADDFNIDVILGKALGVLGHAELFEPVRNLLALRRTSRASCDAPVEHYPN